MNHKILVPLALVFLSSIHQAHGVACDPTNPGCFIAPLIRDRCATCHDRLGHDFGRLDMSRWLPMPDGSGVFNFPQVDPDGRPMTPDETFRDIWYRVTTSDPDLRMPLGDRFKDDELQMLRAWMGQQGPQ